MVEGPRKGWPNIACATFSGWPTAATGLPHKRSKKYKLNSSIKQRPLVVANWNVRTLRDTRLGARRRTALIACELARYNIDIAALSETILPCDYSLVEMGTGYGSFRSGLPIVARRINVVGFAVRTALLQSTQVSAIEIDERLIHLRLPLAKNRFATFVSVYAPTLDSSDDVKDRFYDTLSPSEGFMKRQNHIAGRFQC